MPLVLTQNVLNEDDARVRLAVHAHYKARNIRLVDKNDARGVVIYCDPRHNLKQLVYRSLYDYAPRKFTEKPQLHPDARSFHDLIKAAAPKPEDQGFVDYYVNTLGTRQLLLDIFQVARWKDHPQVLGIKFEDFIDRTGENRAARLRAVTNIADFLGVSLSESDQEKFAEVGREYILKKDRSKIENNKYGYSVEWQDLFSDEDRLIFDEHFGELVADLGYERA